MEGYAIKGFTGPFYFSTKDELRVWIDGVVHGLFAFAHWKGGVMYVGTSGMTYKEAIEMLYTQYKIVTGEDYKEE